MGDRKTRASRQFNIWSESYDHCILQWILFGPAHRAIFRRIDEHFGMRPIRILDVGCGTGVFAAHIHQLLPRATIVGMDLTAGMLQKGHARWRKLAGAVVPVQGDSERLPFETGSFDVVTCANSFHHYPHQDRAVAEMYRVLAPGGKLIVVDGYRDALWGWLVYDLCVSYVEGGVHHASRKRMGDLFAAAGFQETVQQVHPGPAPFLMTEGMRPLGVAVPNSFRKVAHGRLSLAS